MRKITIKRQHLPQRCEICHQSDYFNPLNNYCKRCSPLSNLINKNNRKINNGNAPVISDGLKYSSIIVFTFISLMGWILAFSEYGSSYIGEKLGGLMLIIMITTPAIAISALCKSVEKNHR
jgi:hypothetical protein